MFFGYIIRIAPDLQRAAGLVPLGDTGNQHRDLPHDDVQFQEIDEGMRKDPRRDA